MSRNSKFFCGKILSAILIFAFFITQIQIVCAETASPCRYPDYCKEYIGKDKFEKFNRKMFNFNTKLNKYALRPLHVVWASIMPKYGMDRIQSAYHNIEYPKRLVSSLLQKDFKAAKTETLRFLANTTIGLGGMYDPAKSLLKIQPKEEDIEQALSKCKVKRGPYLVLPIISGTTPRALTGRIIETGLDPTTYIASPIAALVKMGLFVNRTSYMQPLAILMERTFADPYDITRKLYGMENYIKNSNLDREDVLASEAQFLDKYTVNSDDTLLVSTDGKAALLEVDTIFPETEATDIKTDIANKSNENEENKKEPDILNINEDLEDNKNALLKDDKIATNETLRGGAYTDNKPLQEAIQNNSDIDADIILENYNPQHPVIDSMRTALFSLPDIDKSMWSELSIWNRSFQNRIRTSSVEIYPNREKCKFRYIMQKDKSSPMAILYPSIGEGTMAHHSVVMAKLFYDAGYSVIIQGSHFHWEFMKSAPKNYRPGLPQNDAEHLKIATGKILDKLENKYDTKFRKKVLLGTSFGAMTALFIADKESRENTLNIDKYISINPPVELMYSLKELDKNNDEWNLNPNNIKHRTAITAAKILSLVQKKDEPDFKIDTLPFNEYEGKLITGFILRQKLSDVIFTLENSKKTDKSALYNTINNMSFHDYATKYLINDENKTIDDYSHQTSIHLIANYLKNNNNYKIYHAMDDYLTNRNQLKKLKEYTGKNTTLMSNGGHLGFLYRQEFMDDLKREIKLN